MDPRPESPVLFSLNHTLRTEPANDLPIGGKLKPWLILVPGIDDRRVRVSGHLADEVDDVHAPTVDTLVHPEFHHVVDGLPDVHLFPIEVGLLRDEQVEVPFVRLFVVLPSGPRAEDALPVVWGQLLAVRADLALGPVKPFPLRVIERRTRFLEPFVLAYTGFLISSVCAGLVLRRPGLTSLEQWLTTRSCTSFIPCL